MGEKKQLIANNKSSYDDFGLYIRTRNPSLPVRKTNTQTVPGAHGFYDFSSLYGEVIYESRTVEYVLDVTGTDVEDLDTERRKVLDWLLNINETEIYDEYIPGYHWYGSYSDGTWEEDAEQGKITVKFLVYPFLIANNETSVNVASTTTDTSITITNSSSHSVIPTITTDGAVTITIGSSNVTLSAGTWTIDNFYLAKGDNTITINGEASVTITYTEEVF